MKQAASTKDGTSTQARSAETVAPRDRILAAALDLFFRQGFAGTSVREITDACGLTPGALYNHFPSKEALLFAIIARASAEGERQLLAALAEADPDPVSQLRAFVESSTLYHTRHRAEGLVALFQYHELSGEDRDAAVERRRRFRSTLEGILEHGVKANVFMLPPAKGPNQLKITATAIVNIAIRATDLFGPSTHWSERALATFHADLALQMLGVPIGGPSRSGR